jgi:NADH-quinone oxidoreductase subunit N
VIAAFASILAATQLTLPRIDYTAILPELFLLGGALALITMAALFTRQPPTSAYATVAIGAGVGALITSLVLWHDVTSTGAFTTIDRSVNVDGFAVFFLVFVSSILIVAAILGQGYLQREGIVGCEYYVLALVSGSGAMLMATANDLILIFLSLEVLSIPLYVMAGFDRRRPSSQEAAIKYFVLGAFSSAIFVYGVALVYGATGSTNLPEIGAFLAHNVITSNGVLLAGIGLLLVGFGFKIAAVPFHMWTPDVYQGAPTPATGFMAAIAKAGGFAALLRVFVSTFPTLRTDWQPVVWVLAVLTLVLGAAAALVQRDVKRMLAYSSINHAGFILLGLQAATAKGVAASVYYVFAYGFMTLGAFAVVELVGGKGDRRHDLEDYRGLARNHRVLATAFAVFLLAQAGIPFTTGFFAKVYVVEAAVGVHSYALAVIAMGSAAIAVFFYLRVVLIMFVAEPQVAYASDGEESHAFASETLRPVGIFLCLGVTVVFGIWPAPLIDFARQATLIFR